MVERLTVDQKSEGSTPFSPANRDWWVSCDRFTCWVRTAGSAGTKILDAAPILKKWVGQNFFRMLAYYGAKYEPLDRK